MLKLSKTYLPLLATASLLTLAACSTIDEEIPAPPSEEPAAVLNLNILAPHTISTRAEDREVAATDNENMLHDIRVWAYKSSTAADRDNDLPVGYAEVANANSYGYNKEVNGDEVTYTLNPYTLTMLLPESMYSNADKTALYPMDFYVMANTKQLNTLTSISEMPTRKALREASFGHVGTNDDYGLSGYPVTSANSSDGLPISQIKTNVIVNPNPAGQNLLYKNNDPIELTRAISKLQFYFAKMTGVTGVDITKIEINGEAFPTQQYIFPVENNTTTNNGYGDVSVANMVSTSSVISRESGQKITYGNGTDPITDLSDLRLNALDDPESLLMKEDGFETESATQYVKRMQAATAYGTTYLRETDQQVTGTIYYTIDGVPSSKTFTMPRANDFVRNHQWFVYGYFMGGELTLIVKVMPWELKEATIDYEDHPSVTSALTWTADTYETDERDATNHTYNLTMKYNTTAECKFTIGTPKGFFWTASFSSVSGDPEAFKFVTVVDGEETLVNTISGYIDGNPSTIKIKTRIKDDVPQINTATLHIVVRGIGGKDIPVDYLNTGYNDVYTLIQRANI